MPVQETIVDSLYSQFRELTSYLNEQGEVSFKITAEENFRKALLLAAASHFESRICDALLLFVNEKSSDNEPLVEFVKKQAINRQYHTFFDWNSQNANKFFGLFGESFQTLMRSELANNDELVKSIRAFIEIGRERNRLVHQDFGTFYLEKDAEEIYQLYRIALTFVECIPEKLRQC